MRVPAVLVLAVALALGLEIYHYITRTNRELTRFLAAARYADFGQRFELDARRALELLALFRIVDALEEDPLEGDLAVALRVVRRSRS